MSKHFHKAVGGYLLATLSTLTHADVILSTTTTAPVTSIAFGHARAKVELNTVRRPNAGGTTRQSVLITAPVTAIAPPSTNASIRIGVQR